MRRKHVMQKIKTELMLTDAQKPSFHSTHEGYAILKEEVDELWDEIKTSKAFDRANLMMVNEAVQVAAMAIKFIENLYRVEGEIRMKIVGMKVLQEFVHFEFEDNVRLEITSIEIPIENFIEMFEKAMKDVIE